MASLVKAHSEENLEDRLAFYAHLPFERHAAHLFFQLVSRCYERGNILITSNRSVGEEGAVFGDAVVATAILDRLLHHGHVLTITGEATGCARSAAPACWAHPPRRWRRRSRERARVPGRRSGVPLPVR